VFQTGTTVNFESQTKKFKYKLKHNYNISVLVIVDMWEDIRFNTM